MAETHVAKSNIPDEEKALWEQVRMAVLSRIQASAAQGTAAELRELLELYLDFYRVH